MNVRELFNLSGKTAIVTGGSIGLGSQIARGLAEAGANLVLCARKKDRCETLAEEIRRDHGVRVLALGCDVSREEEVDQLAADALSMFGAIDVLVNNAGITWGARPEEMAFRDWQKVLDVNLNGTFFCCKHIGKAMLYRGVGSIVNIASIKALLGESDLSAPSYVASKGAVISLTRELAVLWAPRGVRVNAIAPGFFPTHMTGTVIRDFGDRLLSRIPLGRYGGEDDLKGVVVLLASAASAFVTGQVYVVDGGETVQ